MWTVRRRWRKPTGVFLGTVRWWHKRGRGRGAQYLNAGSRPKKATNVTKEMEMTAIARVCASDILDLTSDATRSWRGRIGKSDQLLSPRSSDHMRQLIVG